MLCYMLGMALATGRPLLGFTPARAYRVLYFDQENGPADRVQYERWAWHGLGQPPLDLVCESFWCAPFVLGSPTWAATARTFILRHTPEVIVIDTTTPACHIDQENDNAEAARVITTLRTLQALSTPPATLLAIKHAKLRSEGGGYTLRGGKAWEGAVDSIIYHVRAEGHPRKDGLANTTLYPAKTRAFGLRVPVHITPAWTPDHQGLVLTRVKIGSS